MPSRAPRLLLLLALSLPLGACATRPQRPRPPRSIVLIVVDALRPDRLTPYGAPRDTSPRVARLAREGTLFKNAVAQANWTLPSLATIMTGLYPSTHRALYTPRVAQWWDKIGTGAYAPSGAQRLDPSRTTLAERLAARGYRTAAVVSGGFCRSEFGFGQGFAEYHNLGSRLGVILPRIKEVLAREPGRPYFLYVHLSDVHDPYAPPPPFDTLWTDPAYRGSQDGSREALARVREGAPFDAQDTAHLLALYDGSMRELDDRLAELLDAVGPEAVVVFTADHGEAFGEHGRLQHGGDAYDEQVRVPLIIRAPGRGAGRVVEPVVELADLAPTVLELAGAPAAKGLPGQSLAPLLDGRSWKERPAFIEAVYDHQNGEEHPFGLAALRTRERKFIRSLVGRPDELYDLAADPGETRNLAAERPAEAARWGRLVEQRLREARRAAEALPPVDKSPVQLDPGLVEKLKASGYVR
jgi:arylsulfatase A-like enzyme